MKRAHLDEGNELAVAIAFYASQERRGAPDVVMVMYPPEQGQVDLSKTMSLSA